ncbi:MAG: pyruvate dehydrogenase (acetyl-transferring) E1 component subunit alpha [Anaerolineae bacterium]|nr:pyruvate dehydrogenase (acetyl-transferring) E1 component subunit alpha [Anaerolineae bacterium]
MARPTKETLLDWYRQIVLIRDFEETCHDLYWQKRITGVYLHLYSGHEAVGVGAVAALRPDDSVITAYRDHGVALARGVDAKAIMAEMMGKRTGTSGGKGGSMHLASREHNFWGGYAIVGGHLPLAVGIALESRYNNKDTVVLSFVGDGATNNGYFHESMNMSAIWDLPVVWLIENNFYGMGTRVEDAAGQPELYKRAVAYGMESAGRVDGQNVVEVNEVLSQAVSYARKKGPILIEAITYRYRGHGVSDRQYNERLSDELEQWKAHRDPITILARQLRERFKNVDKDLERIEQEARKTVDEAVQFAEMSPAPDYDDLIRNVYVE